MTFFFFQPAHLGLKWKYEVKWYPDGDRSLENVIFVESKPRNLGTYGGMISVKMWTSSEDTTDTATADDPLRIFVQVSAGSSPVLQARVNVLAKVHLFNGSSSPAEVKLTLDQKFLKPCWTMSAILFPWRENPRGRDETVKYP